MIAGSVVGHFKVGDIVVVVLDERAQASRTPKYNRGTRD